MVVGIIELVPGGTYYGFESPGGIDGVQVWTRLDGHGEP